MKVPFAVPECGDDEIKELSDVIESGWLTTASRCAQFERDFAEFVGAKHALAVNSATAALHLGLEALGIREGDMIEKAVKNRRFQVKRGYERLVLNSPTRRRKVRSK